MVNTLFPENASYIHRKSNEKRSYGYCDINNLNRAVEAVQNGMLIRKAATEYDVKRSTLYDHVKGKHTKKAGMYSKRK